MRLRDESLRTGRLLAALCPGNPTRSCGLLLLVRGYEDVDSLATVEAVLGRLLSVRPSGQFRWFDVADFRRIAELHPSLKPNRVVSVELAEFAGLNEQDVEIIFRDALERAAAFETTLFPSIGAAVGSAAEGVQFIARAQELDNLAALLDPARLVLVIAPRRTGKTSLLREFTRRSPAGITAVHVDIESAFTVEEAAAAIAVELANVSLSTAIERVTRRGADTVIRRELRAFRERSSGRAALFIDELVYFLRTMTSELPPTDHPAASLELVRMLADACRETDVCLAVAGSIELTEYLTDELGIDPETLPLSIRSAQRFALPPLLASNGHVRALLIGAGIVPEGNDPAWLREHVDLGMPLAAIAFLDQLAAQVRGRGAVHTNELDDALDDFLDRTAVFRDVMDRLQARSLSYAGFRAALAWVMGRLADSPEARISVSDALERFGDLAGGFAEDSLRWLVENLPVRREGETLVLASRIFGRWWRRHHP